MTKQLIDIAKENGAKIENLYDNEFAVSLNEPCARRIIFSNEAQLQATINAVNAQSEPIDDGKYYLQRVPSNYLGNSPFWWAVGGNGYTAYIQGAERFSYQDAKKYVDEDPKKWRMYKCFDIDKRLHLVFDSQDFKFLGTDKPCGWPSGYAKLNSHSQTLASKPKG